LTQNTENKNVVNYSKIKQIILQKTSSSGKISCFYGNSQLKADLKKAFLHQLYFQQ
jgi:hypothetical protein